MEVKKKKKVFVEGAIKPQFIADSIAKHSTKKNIGAHDIFLGQVRSDVINGQTVKAIDYSAYEAMAEEKFHDIREAAFSSFSLICMHIYHSTGRVKAGEVCLFVFVSAEHRKEAFKACQWVVEEIKGHVPIFGKEVFEDETYVWKENKF